MYLCSASSLDTSSGGIYVADECSVDIVESSDIYVLLLSMISDEVEVESGRRNFGDIKIHLRRPDRSCSP
jgi:hypothetical protein